MERITWDQFFMAQSHLLALRSTCSRLAVGSTIVREKRIIAAGYAGYGCNDGGGSGYAGSTFVLIVVLFILLIIVGATFVSY